MSREAFEHYQLRVRRLVDVSKADFKTEVFGATWDMPIYVSAVGGLKAFHPEGESTQAPQGLSQCGQMVGVSDGGRQMGSARQITVKSL
jgi:isopentenyl diphosphate isomerase/L-lactate dehydrogenase-like FMN-dependent dehydrogenase